MAYKSCFWWSDGICPQSTGADSDGSDAGDGASASAVAAGTGSDATGIATAAGDGASAPDTASGSFFCLLAAHSAPEAAAAFLFSLALVFLPLGMAFRPNSFPWGWNAAGEVEGGGGQGRGGCPEEKARERARGRRREE